MLPGTTGERLACDAAVVEVTEDSRGKVLDAARRRRAISAVRCGCATGLAVPGLHEPPR